MTFLLTLDVTTMITVSMALYVLCFIVQLMVLRWNPDIPGTRLMAWGHVLGSVGYFFLLMRAFGLYVPSILIGNALVAGSYYLYFCGLGVNAGRPPHRHDLFMIALCLYMVFLFHFATDHVSLPIRVAMITFFVACLSLASAVQIWPKLAARSTIHWLMALIFTVHSCFLLNWSVRNLLNLSDPRPMLAGGSYMTPIYFQCILFIYAINMAYLVIISTGLQDRLRRQARVDHLTGLYNRMAFDDLSGQIFSRAAVAGSPVAVLMLDLDHFKAVNDTHGHAVGDEVLTHFARTLSGSLRPTDLMARFGGEEFVVLLPDTEAGKALGVAERLRILTEKLSFPCSVDRLKITVSIGVAVGEPAAGEHFESIFHHSDEAMYRAKDLGRNRVELAGAASHEKAFPVPQV